MKSVEVLNTVERGRLEKHERTIREGMQTFVEVGQALTAIRDARLYREQHKTFEAYCKDRWGFEDRYARRLMASAGVVENLKTGPIGPLPKNEAQARILTKLPGTEQPAAWQEVVETAPKDETGEPQVTARHVESVVAKRIEPDQTGPIGPVSKPVKVDPLPDQAAKPKPGGEVFPLRERKEAAKLFGKLVRLLSKFPIYNRLRPQLTAIHDAIEGKSEGRAA